MPKTLHILFIIFNKNNVVHFASLRNYTHHLSNKIMRLLGMNVVFPLFLFAVMGLIIPAYAQNVSYDEVDIMIRELIQECQEKIMADKSVTEAAKTVAKRNCETKITNEYNNIEIDYKKQSEKRIQLQNMQNCENWYPQYQFLTEQQFRLQKYGESASDCIILYNDSVWQYIGEGRLEKLHNRLDEIKSELPQAHETRYLTLDVDISDSEPKIIDAQKGADKVADLEEKVRSLEEELSKKDEIIREQLKVIMDLANRIKNVMFGIVGSFLMQW